MDGSVYHEGMRALQDHFGTRALADKLDETLGRSAFTAQDRVFIESRPFFFLASADAAGRPDCSYKGGDPGFVRVVSDVELAFPGYDGNGMFRSAGNVRVNPAVGLLFIDFERPSRLRVNGVATLALDDPLVASFPGAQWVIRVRAEKIFPNCPRYVHRATAPAEPSPYVPREDQPPPEPAWKSWPAFKDLLPSRTRGRAE